MSWFDQRLCPVCGVRTAAANCASDGTATVVLRRYNPASRVEIGHVIAERWRVTGLLGRGGYATVFAGVHVLTGQEVALKVLRGEYGGPEEGAIRRFYREARVTAQLHHPNTVRVFDVGQTDGGAFFLAMEMLQGPSLEDVLQERLERGETLSEAEALDVAIPVLRSLQEAHSQRMVHRDLKPANIVLADFKDGERTVKVVDFGIAFIAGSALTTTGMALGTPAYMSPEQCQALELDGRSDLYSLGIVLFRCVTGDVPFAQGGAVEIMQAHLSAPLPDLEDLTGTPLSPGFVALVRKALEKEPFDRFQSATEMRKFAEQVRQDAWADTPIALPAVGLETQPLPRTPVKPARPASVQAMAAESTDSEPAIVGLVVGAPEPHAGEPEIPTTPEPAAFPVDLPEAFPEPVAPSAKPTRASRTRIAETAFLGSGPLLPTREPSTGVQALDVGGPGRPRNS